MSKQTDLINVTDAITVSGSNVGIGTSSPDSYYAKKLVVDCGTDVQNGITIKSSTTGAGMFAFADGTSGSDRYRGYINYNHANDSMTLGTAGGAGLLGIDATGAVTMPAQPAFLVTKNSDQNNIATGSEVTVTWQAEVFDQNSDFASNVFTAPVTGKYLLTSAIRVDNLDTASNYYNFLFTTSNRVYRKIIDYGGLSGDPVYWFFSLTAIADMDAGDTASVKIYQNNGTAQMDIIGDVTRSYFSGYLVA